MKNQIFFASKRYSQYGGRREEALKRSGFLKKSFPNDLPKKSFFFSEELMKIIIYNLI